MNTFLLSWIKKIPNIDGYEHVITACVASFLVFLIALIAFLITKRIGVHLVHSLFNKTSSELDDVLIKHKVFNRLALLVPSWIIYHLMPEALEHYTLLSNTLATATALYCVWVLVLVVDAVLNALLEIYHRFPISRRIPIQNFGQVAKLLVYFIAIIISASLILGESPMRLFAGLGAMTAVLMLVFKDPILGFVAGLQLSYNKMVALGDWIEIPQHKVDGDILEIGLTTVKVRNFDNTITTLPTQSLINDSFKNWRGMQESGGRRIKRAIHIDINSIKFCNEEALKRYSKIDYIQDYIDCKAAEVEAHNKQYVRNQDSHVNGRRLTNIGTFRAYLLAYLKNHPQINQHLTLLVRQLAPTEAGLPLEVYVFSVEKNWIKYEAIQADIFDHFFAVAAEFDLQIFQKPSGSDLAELLLNER